MASSAVQICNSALIKIGADRIISLDDDNKRAQYCKEQYPKLRDELLRAHPWNFAIKRKELGQLATTPEFEFTYEYQLPTDCLRVLKTSLPNVEEYSIEGRKLLSTSQEVSIKYISQVTDTSLFDKGFEEVLAFRLAADLAYGLVQNAALQGALFDEYQVQLSLARSYDAQEGFSDNQIEADTWLNSRF